MNNLEPLSRNFKDGVSQGELWLHTAGLIIN